MVLLEDEDYKDLVSGAQKSEQLEKKMLALQILAADKTAQAEAAMAEAERAKADVEVLKLKAQQLEHNYSILMEHYALSRQRQFGTSSEKTPVGQEQMLFNEADACASPDSPDPEIVVDSHTRTKRKRGTREIDLSLLPVEEIRYEFSDEEKCCRQCSSDMHQIGEEVTSKLKFVPGHFVHEKHIRPILGCRPCDRNEISTPIITARMPKQAFPKSLASVKAGLKLALAHFW